VERYEEHQSYISVTFIYDAEHLLMAFISLFIFSAFC